MTLITPNIHSIDGLEEDVLLLMLAKIDGDLSKSESEESVLI